ncbi:MAG: hypothetical protein AAF903_11695 [Pseudomonadota bacterium]
MSVALTDSTGRIYNFDPILGELRLVLNTSISLSDIGFTPDYGAYLISSSGGFYQLDPFSGTTSFLTTFDGGANSLVGFSGTDTQPTVFYGGDMTSTVSGYSQGAFVPVFTLPTGVQAAGDIAFFDDLTYVAADDGYLYQYDTSNNFVGRINVGRNDIEGLALSDGQLYVFASNGDYYRLGESFVQLQGNVGTQITGAATLWGIQMDEFASRQDGTDFDDLIIGNRFDNNIYGEDGNDLLIPLLGINLVNGGDGTDQVAFSLPPSEYHYETTITGAIWVRWWDGATLVSSTVEEVWFSGVTYDFAELTTILSGETHTRGWFYGNEYSFGWHYDLGWSYGWNVGWHNGWNVGWQYGWNVGWHNGWYLSATWGWTVGWHVGWGFSYYYGWAIGWYQGWGVSWYYGWYADFGWNQAWNWYNGWHVAA